MLLRYLKATPIQSVEVNGKSWKDYDKDKEIIRLEGLTGMVTIMGRY